METNGVELKLLSVFITNGTLKKYYIKHFITVIKVNRQ